MEAEKKEGNQQTTATDHDTLELAAPIISKSDSNRKPHCAGAMAANSVFVLPGDEIDASLIPTHPKKPLRLGPGLRHAPPNDIIPTLAGQLISDHQKNAIRVETSAGRVSTPAFHPKERPFFHNDPPFSHTQEAP